MVKYALDTNALNNKELLKKLFVKAKKKEVELFLSPIVVMEYGYIQMVRGKLEKFLRLLKEMQIKIFKIAQKEAILAIKLSYVYKDTKDASYYFRDALIAASCEAHGVILITENIQDFKGLKSRLKIRPDILMKSF